MSGTEGHRHTNYFAVWIILMVLMLGSVAITRLSLTPVLAAFVLFGAAFAKAIIVGLYFMHLKGEHFLVTGLLLSALTFFAIMTLLLVPDFVGVPGML